MRCDSKALKVAAKGRKKQHQKTLVQLDRLKDNRLEELMSEHHEATFAETDCLQCANCCVTTGPLFTNKDIERISGVLKLSPGAFTTKYLRIDEDQDYVLQQLPCPFLGPDNYCGIYDHRPKACREYPHTDMTKQKNKLKLHLKNTAICPAVFEIFEKISKELNLKGKI